jgi:tryptophanyl-tRNA synthetase
LKVKELEKKYISGGFGYGHAKQELFELICDKFKKERESFNHLMRNTDLIENELLLGAKKASKIANDVLSRVRSNIGYS